MVGQDDPHLCVCVGGGGLPFSWSGMAALTQLWLEINDVKI